MADKELTSTEGTQSSMRYAFLGLAEVGKWLTVFVVVATVVSAFVAPFVPGGKIAVDIAGVSILLGPIMASIFAAKAAQTKFEQKE